MNKRILALLLAALMVVALAACGGGDDTPATDAPDTPATDAPDAPDAGPVANADKPLVWFNRQPSNATTGELDMEALQFNDETYYVGFDAVQGAELQGQMVMDFLTNKADASIDRNGDGIIGYVLAIGDVGHNDSIARTRGARLALGTGKGGTSIGDIDPTPIGTNTDGTSTIVQDGKVTIAGKEYIVRELASQEMKNAAGATWDAPTAGNTIQTWAGSFGDQIDLVVSNNDGMGMSIFNNWSQENNVPTFGYDANSDAVAAIADGFGGTISQHADVQAYLTLRLIRNALDGGDMDLGIGTPDDAGNVLEASDYKYVESERSYYALNLAITADNYEQFLDATAPYGPVSNQLDESTHPAKKVWLDIYNASDNFLNESYKPLLENYDGLLNLDVEYVAGDGQSESSISDRFVNLDQYDGFCVNICKTDNAATYIAKLQ